MDVPHPPPAPGGGETPSGVDRYPVTLALDGVACLVVGGGPVARRKVEGLLPCGAAVTVVAPDLDPGLEELAAAGRITVVRRRYRSGDVTGYRLVFAATGDRGVDRAASGEADAAGVWVNSADDPEGCTFTLPAVARRGPITVAVSTGGQSPAMAGWLRRRFEAELGPEYLQLLQLLREARANIKGEGRPTEGLDWLAALDSNMLDLIRAGQIGKARERLQACLSSS
ncbi:MAG TPA: bifunctional precorrin-2 dehydrogenase/sirohydrochlorin ferrochelatase [Acidimicrobiales bacterium]|nr:bifunctional precorrin-2 dehydrogenase/sirohydrochlorin ferrochelatase [Acidimicrobiales bacterium]